VYTIQQSIYFEPWYTLSRPCSGPLRDTACRGGVPFARGAAPREPPSCQTTRTITCAAYSLPPSWAGRHVKGRSGDGTGRRAEARGHLPCAAARPAHAGASGASGPAGGIVRPSLAASPRAPTRRRARRRLAARGGKSPLLPRAPAEARGSVAARAVLRAARRPCLPQRGPACVLLSRAPRPFRADGRPQQPVQPPSPPSTPGAN